MMKINLLNSDRKAEEKRADAEMFVASIGGICVGGLITLVYIAAERLCGIV